MSYILKNIHTGCWVTPSGSARSYTNKLQNARIFHTREAAERERCGNERIQTVEEATNAS